MIPLPAMVACPRPPYPLRLASAFFLAVLLALLRTVEAKAADASAAPPSVSATLESTNRLTLETVTDSTLTISNLTELALNVRTNALAQYTLAREHLLVARKLEAETAQLDQELQAAPALLLQLRTELDQAPAPTASDLSTNAPTSELEQRLAQLELNLAQIGTDNLALQQEPKRRADRAAELTRLLADSTTTLTALQQTPASTTESDDPELIRQASRDLATARILRRQAERNRYAREIALLQATVDLPTLRLDQNTRQRAALSRQRELLQDLLNRRRQQETLQATARAAADGRRARILTEPAVSQIANRNTALARLRVDLATRSETSAAELTRANTNLTALHTEFQNIRNRVETAARAGLRQNYTIGILLRRQQAALLKPATLERQLADRRTLISESQLAQLALLEERRTLADLEQTTATLLTQVPAAADATRKDEIAEEIRHLLREQRTLLQDLSRDYEDYLGKLTRLQVVQEDLLRELARFQDYLSRRILWIRSTEPLSWSTARQEAARIAGILHALTRKPFLEPILLDFRTHTATYTTFAVGVLALLLARPLFLRRLAAASEIAQSGLNSRFLPTLDATLCTAFLVLPIPLALWFLGTRFALADPESLPFERLANALRTVAISLLFFAFYREVFRDHGLAISHFRWPDARARQLRQPLTALILIITPLSFLNFFFEGDIREGLSNRLAFVPVTLVVAWFGHWLVHPTRGFWTHPAESTATSSLSRPVHYLAYAAAVGFPLLIALTSIAGYNYTARQIWMRVFQGVVFVLLLQGLGALLFRWLYLSRRQLAIAHAEKRRTAEAASRGGSPDSTNAAAEYLKGLEADIQSELRDWLAQAQRLLRAALIVTAVIGLLAIWSGVRPALEALDQVRLWQREPAASTTTPASAPPPAKLLPTLAPASPTASTPDQPAESPAPPPPPFVSLLDLVLAIFTLILTLVATRNLPGFLEVTLLSRLRLVRGEGYAITTVVRYVIALVGLISVSNFLGLTWTKIQWLAAAVTVGIGFGLQEIFGNFVSGLILLFERPVRIGDVITVGDVSGVVSRIQIRATTIRDWDNKELILPNKELITGRFVNWTLSDATTRILINVGVAYDANLNLARQILLEIARRDPRVLPDPAPSVIFEGFGDSTLNLTLRAYVATLDARLPAINDMNCAILEEFRRTQIEIAFPQRDIHVRSFPPNFPGPSLASPAPSPTSPPTQPPTHPPSPSAR